jgi:hypothetical protein
MIVRDVIVRAIEADRVELEPAGACEGCRCGGRCVFGSAATLALPLALFERVPSPGARLRLGIDEAELRRISVGLFGRLLAGLLAGATVGAGLASLLSDPIEGVIVAGAVAGTLVALWRSQQASRAAAPRIETLIESETPRP